MTNNEPPRGRRIRVLRVIARMNVGGPALQVTGLLEGLDREQFDQRLLTGHVERGEGDFLSLRAPNLPVTQVDGLGRSPDVLGDPRALRTLVHEMRSFRPDIVHTHTAKAGVLGRAAATLARVPVLVHTFHGHLLRGYFSPPVTAAVIRVERLLARRTTRLIAVGETVRDELLTAGIGRPDQYAVVPPGIPLGPLPPRNDARQRLELPSEGRVVTLVARLTSIKRADRFVDVAKRLTTSHPDVTFAICGEGDMLEALQTAATTLGERLRFLGWRADVETVYAATDVVALCSDNEGMPVSLIEAALAGVPAVATRVGSVGEVVLDGRSGLLTGTSAGEIADAVARLLDDEPLRARMGMAAQEHARANFGQSRLVADTERLYQELVESKGLRSP